MYDQHSARLLRSTNWRQFGALWNPDHSVRQWGQPLNQTELVALGQARLAAASTGAGVQLFMQHHPADQRAHILCRAVVSTSPGWSIDLLDADTRPTGWALKGDRGAELRCDCHCDWNASCPGVVSVPAGSIPRPPSSAPVSMRWPELPLAAPAQVEQHIEEPAACIPEGWRWPALPPANITSEDYDRGQLHPVERPYHDRAPALPAPQTCVPAARRGWFAALFTPRAETAPQVERLERIPTVGNGAGFWPAIGHEDALSWPAVQSPQWNAPELAVTSLEWMLPTPAAPLGDWENPEYRGELEAWAPDPHQPASALEWSGPPAASWEASLMPPDPILSSQAEIDAFIEMARGTAPALAEAQSDTDCQIPLLPSPEDSN